MHELISYVNLFMMITVFNKKERLKILTVGSTPNMESDFNHQHVLNVEMDLRNYLDISICILADSC